MAMDRDCFESETCGISKRDTVVKQILKNKV